MIWHAPVLSLLRESGLFREVRMEGAKVRATLDDNRFLDIHFDPESRSYSYAFWEVFFRANKRPCFQAFSRAKITFPMLRGRTGLTCNWAGLYRQHVPLFLHQLKRHAHITVHT